MRIAITSQGNTIESIIDLRFGRASSFLICDEDAKSWEHITNEQNLNATQGAGIQAASTVAKMQCDAVITGHCGPKAYKTLTAAGIAVYSCSESKTTVARAMELYKQGTLPKLDTADVEGHW